MLCGLFGVLFIYCFGKFLYDGFFIFLFKFFLLVLFLIFFEENILDSDVDIWWYSCCMLRVLNLKFWYGIYWFKLVIEFFIGKIILYGLLEVCIKVLFLVCVEFNEWWFLEKLVVVEEIVIGLDGLFVVVIGCGVCWLIVLGLGFKLFDGLFLLVGYFILVCCFKFLIIFWVVGELRFVFRELDKGLLFIFCIVKFVCVFGGKGEGFFVLKCEIVLVVEGLGYLIFKLFSMVWILGIFLVLLLLENCFGCNGCFFFCLVIIGGGIMLLLFDVRLLLWFSLCRFLVYLYMVVGYGLLMYDIVLV